MPKLIRVNFVLFIIGAVLVSFQTPKAFASESSRLALMADERVEVMKANAENRQEFRQERRASILEQIAQRVDARFTRHEERLQNWLDKVSQHIAKRESDGRDMSAAKTALDTAKSSLSTATQLGDDAVAKLTAVTPDSWENQKPEAIAAREAVKKAQLAYAQVVKDMRAILVVVKKAE